MKVFRIVRKQIVPIEINEAWEFFSKPSNLEKITPAHMGFKIQHKSGGEEMFAGQIIEYKLNIVPGIQTTWITEITHVQPPFFFVDEQRAGPYAMWHHQHHFKTTDQGTEVIDEVNYAIPLGIIGRLANSIFVAGEVNRIFEHRAKTLEKMFGTPVQIMPTL